MQRIDSDVSATEEGGVTTLTLLLSAARPPLARFWSWLLDGAEAEVQSRRTGMREHNERERLRKRYLLADLDRQRREIEST